MERTWLKSSHMQNLQEYMGCQQCVHKMRLCMNQSCTPNGIIMQCTIIYFYLGIWEWVGLDIMQYSMLTVFTTKFCLYSCLSIPIKALKHSLWCLNHSNPPSSLKWSSAWPDFWPIFFCCWNRRWSYYFIIIGFSTCNSKYWLQCMAA